MRGIRYQMCSYVYTVPSSKTQLCMYITFVCAMIWSQACVYMCIYVCANRSDMYLCIHSYDYGTIVILRLPHTYVPLYVHSITV